MLKIETCLRAMLRNLAPFLYLLAVLSFTASLCAAPASPMRSGRVQSIYLPPRVGSGEPPRLIEPKTRKHHRRHHHRSKPGIAGDNKYSIYLPPKVLISTPSSSNYVTVTVSLNQQIMNSDTALVLVALKYSINTSYDPTTVDQFIDPTTPRPKYLTFVRGEKQQEFKLLLKNSLPQHPKLEIDANGVELSLEPSAPGSTGTVPYPPGP